MICVPRVASLQPSNNCEALCRKTTATAGKYNNVCYVDTVDSLLAKEIQKHNSDNNIMFLLKRCQILQKVIMQYFKTSYHSIVYGTLLLPSLFT